MEVTVFLCEDSQEGILTGVYDAWEEAVKSGRGHESCRLATCESQQELFCSYRTVRTSPQKAEKVIRTLRKRLGEEVYMRLCYAMASCEQDKAEAVYKTIVEGLSMTKGERVLDKVTNPYVARTFDLQRSVWCELHHEYGFARFRELANGVLLSKITPKNNIAMFLAPHFSDRFPLENFIIYDVNRHLAVFHEKGKAWYLMDALELDEEAAKKVSTEEEYYQRLFRLFCRTIAIESRENRELQRQNLPLRFRGNMPEFESVQSCKKV